MSQRPFSARLSGGVLQLTLDTPGSDFNVLGNDAASQLVELLAAADRDAVRAVVLRSGKPGSFVNGVGLMMAGMTQAPEDAARLTEPVRRAYRALREFPAPTIAVIRGNCYGCGVELSLHCDYRFAADTHDTHFYMTEIADYLFVPVFGGTQELPRLLGLEAATRLVLWGERWSAREAARRGLVDGCFDDDALDAEVELRLPALVEKRAPIEAPPWTPELDAHVERVWRRVDALPPAYQGVYFDAFALMVRAARKARLDEADYALERAACGRSVVEPISKAALSFFFVRQLAQQSSLRGFELPPGARLVILEGDARLEALRADLVARRVRGVAVCASLPEAPHPGTLLLAPLGREIPGAVDVALELLAPRTRLRALTLYAPLLDAGVPLVEIACEGEPDGDARALYRILHAAGLVPIFSRPRRAPAIHDLLAAFLTPLVAFFLARGAPADVHATLRDLGFMRPPSALLAALPGERLARLLEAYVPGDLPATTLLPALEAIGAATYEGGVVDEDLRDAVLTSLLEFAAQAQEDRVVSHPAVIDLMARELIDFPLGKGSLCRYLTRELAGEMLARRERFACLLPVDAPARSERFASSARGFYQTRGRSSLPPSSTPRVSGVV